MGRMGLVRQSEMISWGIRLRVRVMSIEILREIDTTSAKCDRRMDEGFMDRACTHTSRGKGACRGNTAIDKMIGSG